VSGIPTPKFEDKAQRQIDSDVGAEARLPYAAPRTGAGCPARGAKVPRAGTDRSPYFLFAAGSTVGAAAAAVVGSVAQAADQNTPRARSISMSLPIQPKSKGVQWPATVGTDRDRNSKPRSAGAFPTANEYSSWSMTPLDKVVGNLTASGLHFERHHGGIPTIDPSTHMLFVHGKVDAPRKFSMVI